jgi:hypothetical protein
MDEHLSIMVRVFNAIADTALPPAAETPPAASPRTASAPTAPVLRPARPPYVPPMLADPSRPLVVPEDPMDALEENNKFRGGGSGGLWPIASLPAWTPYQCGRPIFAPSQWLTNINAAEPLTQEGYNNAFFSEFPEIMHILPMEGVVIAGGAAAQPFNKVAGDIDFFFVGVERAALWAKVAELDDAIHTSFANSSPRRKTNFITTMTQGVITIIINRPPFHESYHHQDPYPAQTFKLQIILRLFPNVEYLLQGFDLGSCAVAFDGITAYTTLLGAFSLLHRVNIVCPSRRSTSYEARLKKYFERQYALVLPYLDLSLLVPGKTLELPFLQLQVEKVYGLLAVGSVQLGGGEPLDARRASDYEDSDSALAPSWTSQWRWQSATNMVNSWRFAKGIPGFVIRGVAMQNHRGYQTEIIIPFTDYAESEPGLQDVLPRQDFIDIVHSVAKKVFRKQRLNVVTLRQFFGLSQEQVNRFAAAVTDVALAAAAPSDTINTLPALRPFCDALIARYDAAVSGGKIDWVVVGDPSSQCTATLNPRIVDPRIWYGAAFTGGGAAYSPAYIVQAIDAMIDMVKGKVRNPYDNICAICFNALDDGGANTMTLGCGHMFHWDEDPAQCRGLRCWANANCPTCRRPYDRATGALLPPSPVPPVRRSRRIIPVMVDW